MPPYTYHNNRTVFLDSIFKKKGWIQAQEGEKADFGLWATHGTPDRDSTVKLYSKNKTDLMDNKRSFYKYLQEKGELKYIPETYLTWEEVLENNQNEDDSTTKRLWYLKNATSTEGKHVWCYQTLEQLKVYATKPGIMSNYVIQREVADMRLIVGYKVTFRIYVLIWEGKMYLYQRYTGKFHPNPYTTNSLSKDVHVECAATGVVFPFEGVNWEHHKTIFPKIQEMCKTVVGKFLPHLTDGLNTQEQQYKYSLLGLDVIIDQDLNPWLIEINTYPFLWDKNELVKELKLNLLEDLYNFIIAPSVIPDTQINQGKFIKL